ncbi:hypothetical protein [Brevundimonas sp. Leaf363]|uniref:hypothetical protein n=1 Tax=Brevundimonas sp. Leaf363 TaxID=1736353 RepID=UPI0012E301AD|nr:hypothetical protein [Brevundimonas sp. Leaf363]
MRSYEHIAYLLMLMLKKSAKARFRLSRKSLQLISGRDVIKSALIRNISEWMEDVAVILPLNRGGYVVISQESLEGVAPLKIGDIVSEWRTLEISDLRSQLDPTIEDEEE